MIDTCQLSTDYCYSYYVFVDHVCSEQLYACLVYVQRFTVIIF